MLSRTDTHRAHKMPLLAVAFHFVRKLTCSEPNSGRVCVCVSLSWGALIRSTSTANTATNQWDPENWQWMRKMRKCSFIHSFSHQRMCVFTRVCVCVLYEHSSVAGVCEVTDSFIMAGAHRETAPSRGRREEDRDTGGTGPVYCWAGPRHFSCWWRKGGRRGEERGDSCCLL